MIVFSVLYPATDGGRFDQVYYDETHLPLVKSALFPMGLRDVKILKGLSGEGGAAAPYVAMAHLIFETAETLNAAMASPAAEAVMADLPNFTDIRPITQISTLE